MISGRSSWPGGFIPHLKFRQSFTNQFKLHPSIFVNVILIFEYFFYVLFEFQYFSLKFRHPIHGSICKHLPHCYESPHNGDICIYGDITIQQAG